MAERSGHREAYVDLHLHTVASDGTLTPEQLVDYASSKGYKAIAVTDHDSWESIGATAALGSRVGLEVIPGIELSTTIDEREIHILGYFIAHHDRVFQAQVAHFKQARLERAQRMVEKLSAMGVHIEMQRVLQIAGGGSLGRPHVARALLEQGYVGSIDEAFSRYIGAGCPAYVAKDFLSPAESFRLIHDAGGLAFFAHPGIEGADDLIDGFAASGLDGLEVWHAKHTATQAKHYLELATRKKLLVSGGSDFHGEGMGSSGSRCPVRVPYEVVERMKERLSQATLRKWTQEVND
ncbi:MAG TPA: PHP domain-containing protein [Candidatus Edwardsbacteria bacterium]|nr:PHP domain-containing protein [Candidatus Edwardsbacteria bacterium]